MDIVIKRIYEQPMPQDGCRILVDRLWPRGVTKDIARLDLWLKDAAPSPELRKWFGHSPERFAEFSKLYAKELAANIQSIEKILEAARSGKVTLLYAAKDPDVNHAEVLKDFIIKTASKKTL